MKRRIIIRGVGLEKIYDGVTAVDGVSLKVHGGEVYGLFGPNGSGKTTTIRMLTGLIPPDSGSARILGIDVIRRPLAVREGVGILMEGAAQYPEMRLNEYLRFFGRMAMISEQDLSDKIFDSIKTVGLEDETYRLKVKPRKYLVGYHISIDFNKDDSENPFEMDTENNDVQIFISTIDKPKDIDRNRKDDDSGELMRIGMGIVLVLVFIMVAFIMVANRSMRKERDMTGEGFSTQALRKAIMPVLKKTKDDKKDKKEKEEEKEVEDVGDLKIHVEKLDACPYCSSKDIVQEGYYTSCKECGWKRYLKDGHGKKED